MVIRVADPGTINIVKSASTLLSAIILWIALDRKPTPNQWLALCFQMTGLIISQVNYDSKV